MKSKFLKNTLERFLLDNIFYSIDEYLNHSNNNIDNHSNWPYLNCTLRM